MAQHGVAMQNAAGAKAPQPAANKRYIAQARLVLQNLLRQISCAAIDVVLRSVKFNFTDACSILVKIESRRSAIGGDGAGRFTGIPPRIKVFIKHKRPKKAYPAQLDERILRELDTFCDSLTKEATLIDLTADDEAVNGTADKKGPAKAPVEPEVECLCCYGDYPLTDMRECEPGSGHRVCKQCIYNYVSEQLDGNGRASFTCIVDANCQNNYSLSLLDQVLSPKLNKRANDRVFREELKKAGIGNDWTCPVCAYVGFIEGEYPSIICPECNKHYCTTCNEVFHKGITCDEARKQKQRLLDPKHRAHEAMSQACKRFCPHCNQEYQKGDGCNKIRCKCGLLSCYLCGEKIEDYSHFCNHKLPQGATKCTCRKACRLWTSVEEMNQLDRDRRAVAGRKVLAEAGVTNEKEILSILASPPKKKPPPANAKAPARPAAVPAPRHRSLQPELMQLRQPLTMDRMLQSKLPDNQTWRQRRLSLLPQLLLLRLQFELLLLAN